MESGFGLAAPSPRPPAQALQMWRKLCRQTSGDRAMRSGPNQRRDLGALLGGVVRGVKEVADRVGGEDRCGGAREFGPVQHADQRRTGRAGFCMEKTGFLSSVVASRLVGLNFRRTTVDGLWTDPSRGEVLGQRTSRECESCPRQESHLCAPVKHWSRHVVGRQALRWLRRGPGRFGPRRSGLDPGRSSVTSLPSPCRRRRSTCRLRSGSSRPGTCSDRIPVPP